MQHVQLIPQKVTFIHSFMLLAWKDQNNSFKPLNCCFPNFFLKKRLIYHILFPSLFYAMTLKWQVKGIIFCWCVPWLTSKFVMWPAWTLPASGYYCVVQEKLLRCLCKCALQWETKKQCNPCDSLLTVPPTVIQVGWHCCHGNNRPNRPIRIKASTHKNENGNVHIFYYSFYWGIN